MGYSIADYLGGCHVLAGFGLATAMPASTHFIAIIVFGRRCHTSSRSSLRATSAYSTGIRKMLISKRESMP